MRAQGAGAKALRALLVTSAVLGVAAAQTAWAQTTETIPGIDPGQIEKRFEQPQAPRSGFEPVVPAPGQQPTPDQAKEIKFVLQGVDVSGSTVYGAEAFQPLYADLIGKEVSLAQMFDIANAITAQYRNDGYILSQGIVPAQKVQGGVVQIQVVEGFVDRVVVDGEIKDSRQLLQSYGEKIASERPLTIDTLERYLLLANDLPGMTVRGVLSPSAGTPGASELTFVSEQKFVDVFATFDNRGSRFLGPLQAQAGANVNGILGLHERTGVRGVVTTDIDELRFGEITHEQVVGPEGTTVGGLFSYTASQPGSDLEDLDVDSTSSLWRFNVRHPLIRSRSQNLSIGGEFSGRDTETKVLGFEASEDRLRVLRGNATYDFVDQYLGVNLAQLEVSQGLSALGARDPSAEGLSRSGGRSNFTKIRGEAFRLQRLGQWFSVLGEVAGQWAFDELLAAEEFAYGGVRFGRAFDPSEITGDHGLAAKVELRFTRAINYAELKPYLRDYQLYGYYDWGRVWFRDHDDRGLEAAHESGASIGGGIRLNLGQNVSASVEGSKPLIRDVVSLGTKGDNWRFFFTLGARF